MAGQSIADRLMAAQHTIMGSDLAKVVCKATTSEARPPKRKHLDYLISITHQPNINIAELTNILIERTRHLKWVIVFKALVTTHHLMILGSERLLQHLASRNDLFSLSDFSDEIGPRSTEMSEYIRRYAAYLNHKAVSYRNVAFDFTRIKRGKDGIIRSLSNDDLLKTLPVLQMQLDVLLDFDASTKTLNNGIITAAYSLLFKDMIRLFACYNDGIINLLEKFYDMKKSQCKEGLDIYKKFLIRMNKVSEMLKVAEEVGIDKNDIPELSKAPSSFLQSLEQHIGSLEDKKKDHKHPPAAKNQINALKSLNTTLSKVEDNTLDLIFVGDKSDTEASPTTDAFQPFSQQPAAFTASNATSPLADLLDDFSNLATTSAVPASNDFFSQVPATVFPINTSPHQQFPFSTPMQQQSFGMGMQQPLQQQSIFSASPVQYNDTNLFNAAPTPNAMFPTPAFNNAPTSLDDFAALDLLQPINTAPVTEKAISPAPTKPQAVSGGKVSLESSLADLQANLVVRRGKANMGFQAREVKLTGGANFSPLSMGSPSDMMQPMGAPTIGPQYGGASLSNMQTVPTMFGAPAMGNLPMQQQQGLGMLFQPQHPQAPSPPINPNNPFL